MTTKKKLTPREVAAVRADGRRDETQHQQAARYGISSPTLGTALARGEIHRRTYDRIISGLAAGPEAAPAPAPDLTTVPLEALTAEINRRGFGVQLDRPT
jgi:hypothetical protein